jgi:hypothetical protein
MIMTSNSLLFGREWSARIKVTVFYSTHHAVNRATPCANRTAVRPANPRLCATASTNSRPACAPWRWRCCAAAAGPSVGNPVATPGRSAPPLGWPSPASTAAECCPACSSVLGAVSLRWNLRRESVPDNSSPVCRRSRFSGPGIPSREALFQRQLLQLLRIQRIRKGREEKQN